MGLQVFFVLGASGNEVTHGITDAAHPFLDLLFIRIGEAEAELLLSAAIDMEGFTGDEGNVLFGGLTQEGACA